MKYVHTTALVLVLLTLTGAEVSPAVAGENVSTIASHPMIGEKAPEFALEEVEGGTVGLADLRGRYVVIHFGASW
jgi:cytochrome oxidase Cu insertion factor (SCO1/SenC/PrrC family)